MQHFLFRVTFCFLWWTTQSLIMKWDKQTFIYSALIRYFHFSEYHGLQRLVLPFCNIQLKMFLYHSSIRCCKIYESLHIANYTGLFRVTAHYISLYMYGMWQKTEIKMRLWTPEVSYHTFETKRWTCTILLLTTSLQMIYDC